VYNSILKILVLGAGAVGLGIAAKLSTVADVVAIAREQYAKEVTDHGLHLTGAWGEGLFRFRCLAKPPTREQFDYVLITVKSHDTERICQQYADLLRDHPVVSLQNGIGNEEIIGGFTEHVIGGVVMTGFLRKGPCAVDISANAGETILGKFPDGVDEQVRDLVHLFARAGIHVRASGDIKNDLWSKNLISSVLNPLSAILGVPYGDLLSGPARRVISSITNEYYAVAGAEGLTLAWKNPEEFLTYLKNDLIPVMHNHFSSMQQDLEFGRTTEIEFLNGQVIKAGERHGISTPYNSCITELVRFRQEGP
jgi:2-dehydropantoate 2-reductase